MFVYNINEVKNMTFYNFDLRPEILTTLNKINIAKPFEIQKKVLPLALNNKNIIGISPTGSGKTLAYLLPILNKLEVLDNEVQAVIIVPTRELAFQVYEMIRPFSEEIEDLRVTLLSGGLERSKNILDVSKTPHIIIGTPGRIKDIAFKQNVFKISSAKTLILDEIDVILEAGFIEDVDYIIQNLHSDVQTLVFSATIEQNLQDFLNKYLKSPNLIDLTKASPNPSTIEHIAYPTRNQNRNIVLENLLNGINPYIAIIFVNEKKDINDVYRFLVEKGLSVGVIHGDLNPTTRKTMLKRIRNNEFQFIVASDIAARGIDIEGVSHIINYNVPFVEEFYYHRAGRTARANQDGYCYTLYDSDELTKIKHYIDKGVNFKHFEYKNDNWVELKPLKHQQQRSKKAHPKQQEINRVIAKTKAKKVKPGYKRKMNQEIDKIKRKHRREIIKKDIKKRTVLRAIERTKQEKEKGE